MTRSSSSRFSLSLTFSKSTTAFPTNFITYVFGQQTKSMKNFIAKFLEYLKVVKHQKPISIRNTSHYLDRFVSVCNELGVTTPDQITKETLHAFEDSVAHFAPFHRYYHLASLRKLLTFFLKYGIASLHPSSIEISLPKRSDPKLETLPDKIELQDLLDFNPTSMLDYRDKAIINLLYYSGIRLSELVRLTPTQVDLTKNRILIKTSGNRVRVIFLASRAKAIIQAYLNALPFPLSPIKPMFVNMTTAEGLSANHLQRMIGERGRHFGFRITINSTTLRNCLARDLKDRGASQETIDFVLGRSPSSKVNPDFLGLKIPAEEEFHAKIK